MKDNKMLEYNQIKKELDYYKDRALEVMVMGDSVGDGVIITDTELKVVEMNSTFADWLGGKRSNYCGTSLSTISQEVSNMCSIALKHRIKASEIIDAYERKLLVTCNPFFSKSGELMHFIIVCRDMSELNRFKI